MHGAIKATTLGPAGTVGQRGILLVRYLKERVRVVVIGTYARYVPYGTLQ